MKTRLGQHKMHTNYFFLDYLLFDYTNILLNLLYMIIRIAVQETVKQTEDIML